MRRVRARVEGTVQGVGFRPFVYRLAYELDLGGLRAQRRAGCALEVEGGDARSTASSRGSREEAPPLASVEAVRARGRRARGRARLPRSSPARTAASRTRSSRPTPRPATTACASSSTPPTAATATRSSTAPTAARASRSCAASPTTGRSRRWPASRCARAAPAEYEDPADRRFHAQPNACPECGPTLRLLPDDLYGDEALRAAVAALRDGASSRSRASAATTSPAWPRASRRSAALRARKHREDKPFAVMVRDVEAARELVALTDEEAALLAGRDRPIVLAPRRPGRAGRRRRSRRAARDLGVMLPYSPLHHLLLADAGEPLVMTSGNVSDEPIAHEDDDALERLAGIADLVLLHDRPIHTRTDDSVLRAVPRRRPLLLRRSRGFVPDSLALPARTRAAARRAGRSSRARSASPRARARGSATTSATSSPTRCCRPTRRGSSTSSACSRSCPRSSPTTSTRTTSRPATRSRATASRPSRSSTTTPTSRRAWPSTARPAARPARSTTARATAATARCGAARCCVGDLRDFERAAHLWPVRLPGGDRAVRQPWRMAVAWLLEAGWDGPLAGRDRRRRAGRRAGAHRALLAVDDEHGPPVRRGRRALRGARRGDLRGPGGGRARGGRPTAEERRGVRRCPASTPARRSSRSPQDLGRGSRPGASSPPASTTRSRARPRRRGRARRELGVVLSGGVFQNRLLLDGDRGALEARGPARARARASAAQRRRDLATARRRSRGSAATLMLVLSAVRP